eukprot:TRINITY_DN40324_c0_g1_i2.p1 TRINITY_DN40324_c0_g1~~TRINITY_DN40324_c0_g1_i2.p1  ORF type:complete len:101 (+),score=8.86 TRINITY_DN40324_c0_g1_i2:136-438(+)
MPSPPSVALGSSSEAAAGKQDSSGVVSSKPSATSQLDTTASLGTFGTCLTTIPPDLVRAVDIREALSGFGRHWASIEVREEDYCSGTEWLPTGDCFNTKR